MLRVITLRVIMLSVVTVSVIVASVVMLIVIMVSVVTVSVVTPWKETKTKICQKLKNIFELDVEAERNRISSVVFE